jgi:hypothetical protein
MEVANSRLALSMHGGRSPKYSLAPQFPLSCMYEKKLLLRESILGSVGALGGWP